MIDRLGHLLASWLVPVNAWTALLLGCALLLDRGLARHARASLRIALYTPIALRVLLPLSWTIPVAQAPRVITLLTPLPDVAASRAVAHEAAPLFTAYALLAAVYLVGVLLLGARAVLHRVALARALRSAPPIPTVTADCPVVRHPHLGPMVAGFLAPRIVLPEAMVQVASEEALACVLRHELAHLRRRDPWLSVAMQALVVVAWPVLPLWLATVRVRHLVELACDEAAIAGGDAAERRRYGHTLLDLAEHGSLAVGGAAALHFGSSLRARIEALASQRHWPRALQASLVVAVAAGFAACSSVGPGNQGSAPSSRTETATASAAATGAMTEADLQRRCPDFDKRFVGWSDPVVEWMHGPVDGIPASEVAYCRGPEVQAFVEDTLWSAEARNVIGQMAKDLAVAYERDLARGHVGLCPGDGPLPRIPQARGQLHQPTHDEFNAAGRGFPCMEFEMDRPIAFQYTLETTDRAFVITAHTVHPRGDHAVDVTMVLRGEVHADNALNIAPNLEERWTDVP